MFDEGGSIIYLERNSASEGDVSADREMVKLQHVRDAGETCQKLMHLAAQIQLKG